MKFVWALTGAGDLMPEIVSVMEELAGQGGLEITAVLSRAAEQVVKWYRLKDRLEGLAAKVLVEKDANNPFVVGPLQTGHYDFLLVAPVTANTAAKIAHGIADSLVSNAVAQINKTAIPAYLLPVDQHPGTTTTVLPDGSPLSLRIREVDIANVEAIRRMEGLVVLSRPGDIREVVARHRNRA
ncbi:MAG: archaeoflavoprotein AfpA [Solidesulfovibrio sp.]|uniref:archaeoflavoprotein AfpA n=1 Tax=Solidesulfovibrio sp. TaxID=2910990 RepID=UPI002B1FB651|nr:archaeoflavoprotein AfpA [Solidesulfovibrio sp.]MEA4855454.1 archaeoflavoprotein AfpA [Solidesulfovibrio sp.]